MEEDGILKNSVLMESSGEDSNLRKAGALGRDQRSGILPESTSDELHSLQDASVESDGQQR